MAFEIRQATKKAQKARLAIEGPSGSGKTRTALEVAKYLCEQEGGRFVVIDTEAGSSQNYAHLYDFDVLLLEEPYSPGRYVDALQVCEKAGYTAVIIDSLTHEWSGPGGCLDQASQFQDWKRVRPQHQKLIQAIQWSPVHVIVTMRSKEDYAMETDERTHKTTVVKVGMGAIQDKDFGYEVQAVLTMDRDHVAVATKNRSDALDGKSWTCPGADFAQVYYSWLTTGEPDLGLEERAAEIEAKAVADALNAVKLEWKKAAIEAKLFSEHPTNEQVETFKKHLGTLYTDLDGASVEELAVIGSQGVARIKEYEA